MRHLLVFATSVAILGTYALAEDGPNRQPLQISIAVKGLEKGCCDEAVQKALSGIPGVKAVRIEETTDGKSAVIFPDEDAKPRLAAISKALEGAATAMHARGMDVKYEVDRDRFRVTDEATLVVASFDSNAIQTSLARVRGVNGASVESRAGALYVRLRIAPDAPVRFIDLVNAAKSAGGEVTDLVLAPAAGDPTVVPQAEAQPAADPPRPSAGGC